MITDKRTPSEALGNSGEQRCQEVAQLRRRERYELLRWQWDHSTLKRLHKCRLHATGDMVWLNRNEGGAYFAGLQTCGSVWACPVCSAIIRTRRAMMIEGTAKAWLEAGERRSLAFMTLTCRHRSHDELAALYGPLADSWKRFREARWWREIGWAGYWRATEVTWGGNGWHPHMHMLLFGEGQDVDPLELARRWRDAVTAAGMRPTSLRSGTRLQAVNVEGGTMGDYLSKVLDESGRTWDIGSELARADRKRGGKGLSPMEILSMAADGESRMAAKWWEYEQATFGRRAIESSRGLSKLIGVEDVSDEDLVADDEGGEAVLVLHRSEYRRLAKAGALPFVLEAAEDDPRSAVSLVETVLRLVVE